MKHLFVALVSLFMLCLLLAHPTAYAQAPPWQTLTTAIPAGAGNSSTITATAEIGVDVYVVGQFRGTVSFGTTTLTSAGNEDVFIAKWSPSTNTFVWAQRAGGPGSDVATSVDAFVSTIYVAGNFTGTASFGGTTLTSAGGTDGFLLSLYDGEDSGGFNWALRFGGTSNDYATAVQHGGNIYIAGRFSSATANFGTIRVPNASTSGTSFDGFVARVSLGGGTGIVDWVSKVAGTGDDQISAMTENSGDMYLTGTFSNTVTLGTTTLTGAANTPFVAWLRDFGSAGSFSWAMPLGGNITPSSITHLRTSTSTHLYLAGRFSGTATIGSTTLSSGSGNGDDLFVAKITDTGLAHSFVWAVAAGSGGSDYATDIAVDAYQVALRGGHTQVYITGGFNGTIALGSTTLASTGGTDALVARLTDQGATATFTWATSAGGAGTDQAHTVTATTDLATNNTRIFVGGTVSPPASFGAFIANTIASTDAAFSATLSDVVLSTRSATRLPDVLLYPNPARSSATIQLPALAGTTSVVLTLTDALGRVLRTYIIPKGPRSDLHYELDLTGLASSLYTLRIQAGEAYALRQIVLE